MIISKGYNTSTAYRRQKQIEDCLFGNLQLRPYTSVSISDLCHQLEISRKSFYNYYPDKDSCFRAIISRKIRQCILQLTSAPEGSTREDLILLFLNYWKEQRTLLDIIARNNLLYMVVDQCILFFRHEDTAIVQILNTPQLQNDPYVLSVFVTANVTLLLHWYMKGFDVPVEEMVNKYHRIIYRPRIILE